MTRSANFRAEAPALELLISLLKDAAEIMGLGAQWIGFDDRSVHIWAEDSGPLLSIEPATTLLQKRENAERAK